MIFPDLDLRLTTLSPIKYLPAEVYAVLTTNEIREIGGYEPLEDVQPTLNDFTNELKKDFK